jgi:hypothetical protein
MVILHPHFGFNHFISVTCNNYNRAKLPFPVKSSICRFTISYKLWLTHCLDMIFLPLVLALKGRYVPEGCGTGSAGRFGDGFSGCFLRNMLIFIFKTDFFLFCIEKRLFHGFWGRFLLWAS